MSTDSIRNTDRLNYVNIGLMAISCALAFVIPFELFLFAYAVLGPAHYLTEISWLHERKYFTKGKYDFVILGSLAVLLFLMAYVVIRKVSPADTGKVSTLMTAIVLLAFGGGLIMVLAKTVFQRLIGFLLIAVVALASDDMRVFFTVFLPTIIHVYLFTGFFIIFGALKGRSKSGYLSFFIFLLCPLLFIFITPDAQPLSGSVQQTYSYFAALNLEMLKVAGTEMQSAYQGVFQSETGLIIMRFIAFAYTYHYLNWFSKTSVIRWHEIPKKRMAAIVVLWGISIGLYAYNYKLGFDFLFCLSFMHVFLEFPLNHTSIIGTFRELRVMMSGSPAGQAGGGKKGRKK